MSRRVSQQETGFGSDSFLDIVANLVGILIILIVLAGLRASEAPVTLPEPVPNKLTEISSTEPAPLIDDDRARKREARQQRLAAEQERLRQQRSRLIEERRLEAERRSVLIAEAHRIERETGMARKRISSLRQSLNGTNAEPVEADVVAQREKHRENQTSIRVLEATLARVRGEGQQSTAQLNRNAEDLDRLKAQLDAVNMELENLIATRPEKQTLAHHVSPVGRMVLGEEVHFRISGDRISLVPLEELTEVLKDRIRDDGAWLIRNNSSSGHVGPIEGYRLHYTVVREVMSVVNELRVGQGVMRINVKQFSVHPTRGLVEQTIDEALREDGLFIERLRGLAPETTLTLWVYPDSFDSYRRVASFAQRNGFLVAGRPLPAGMPISGSPQGSRSVGQ